mmetsp:Transcript_4210/g.19030  ORF Transcript_4210/g.19030 Transcript_4210/m.19030 type:complete len:183 (-) Transcript_4210:1356-1904(-)
MTCVGLRDSQKALLWDTANRHPFHPCRPSVSARTAPTSRWLEGSSSRRQFLGCSTKAASATRAFSPPDNEPILRSAIVPVIPSAPRLALPCSSFISGSSSRATSRTYSRHVFALGRNCARSCEKTPSLTRSSVISRAPPRSGMVPEIVLSKVDLPAPLGPRTITRMSRSSSSDPERIGAAAS